MKLLIVDDSNFSQKIVSNLLNKYLDDVEFYFANDGEQGFTKYKEINPDYICIDLLMPNLNGKELIKLIKEHNPHAKIIVITAEIQKSIKKDIEQYIVTFVNKPLNEEKAQFICNIIRNDYYE